MEVEIPSCLATSCLDAPETVDWLERLPAVVRALAERWALDLGPPFNDGSAAWVAPAKRPDGSPAVLKLGMPHMEADHELHALRFWNGVGAVRLLDAEESLNAMLLERCMPGLSLRAEPEPTQDVVIAGLLRSLWRRPEAPHPFRHLSDMLARWSGEARAGERELLDPVLAEEGLQLFRSLSEAGPEDVMLVTDLHAGNVLSAERQPWLAIDPKPFVGDPAYDATQHLLNCTSRLHSHPDGTIRRFAGLLDVSEERVRLWTFARVATGLWPDEERVGWTALARSLSP